MRSPWLLLLGVPVVACTALTNLDDLRGTACATCADGGTDAPDGAPGDGASDADAAPTIPTGNVTSVVTWGGAQAEVGAYGSQTRTDASGNIYVAGVITAGGSVIPINNGKSYQPGNSLTPQSMLAKFSPTGDCQWIVPFGGAYAYSLALDPTGTNVYVSGQLAQGPSTIGGKTVTPVGTQDLLVAKVSAAGSVQWVQTFGQAGGMWMGGTVLADGAGNVFVGGAMRWSSPVKIGTVTPTAPATSNNGFFGYVAAFTEAGTPTWARILAPVTTALSRGSGVNALALAKNGDLVVVGLFWDQNQSTTVELDSGGTGAKLVRNGGGAGLVGDVLIAAYRPASAGQFVWATQFLATAAPTGQTAGAASASMAPSGEIYVGFAYSGAVQLAGGGNLADSGYGSLGLAKLDASGKALAIKGYPSTKAPLGVSQLGAVGVDGAGDVVIGGVLSSDVDFGSGLVANSGNSGDAFVVKLDPNLKPRWVKTFAAPFVPKDGGSVYNPNAVTSLAFLPGNAIVAYGSFYGTTKFDGIDRTSNGQADGFLAFMKP